MKKTLFLLSLMTIGLLTKGQAQTRIIAQEDAVWWALAIIVTAALLIIINVVVIRWLFRINEVVDILKSIDTKLDRQDKLS